MYIFLKKNLKILTTILIISIGLLYSINSVLAVLNCTGYWKDSNNPSEVNVDNLVGYSFQCEFDCNTYSVDNCYTPPPYNTPNVECVGDNGDYDTFGPDGDGSDGFGDVIHRCVVLYDNEVPTCSNFFDNIDRNVNQYGDTVGSYCFNPDAFYCWWMEGSNVLKRRWCSDNTNGYHWNAVVHDPTVDYHNLCPLPTANDVDIDVVVTADGWTAMEIPGIEINGDDITTKGGFCLDICVDHGYYLRDYELCSEDGYFSENGWDLNSCPYTQYTVGGSCADGIVYSGSNVCDGVELDYDWNYLDGLLNKNIYGGVVKGVDITTSGNPIEYCEDTYGPFSFPSCDTNCGSLSSGFDVCYDAGGGACDTSGSGCADYGGVGDLDEYNFENWKNECQLFEDISTSYWDDKVEYITSGVFGKEFGEYEVSDGGVNKGIFGPVENYNAYYYNDDWFLTYAGTFNNVIKNTTWVDSYPIVIFDGEEPEEETCGDDQNEFVISNGSITRCCDNWDDTLELIESKYYCIDSDKVNGCGNYQLDSGEECDAVYGVDLNISGNDGAVYENTRKLVGDDSNCTEPDSYCQSDCTCFTSGPICPNDVVESPEVCDPPGDNSIDCEQSQSSCLSNKLGTRDQYGTCNYDCMSCTDDEFVYSCVDGQCGAECSDNSDCDDSTCSETYNDYCSVGILYDYDGDGILDDIVINDSVSNYCSNSDCQCTDNSDQLNCSEPIASQSCSIYACGAECSDNSDCDDGDSNTTDSCLNDCTCSNIPITPECNVNDFNYNGRLLEIKSDSIELMKMDSNGMILLKGNIHINGISSYQEPAQVFKTGTEELMVVDGNGDLYLEGSLDENNSNDDMLIIQNQYSSNDKLRFDPGYIGVLIDNGNLYIKGCIAENSL